MAVTVFCVAGVLALPHRPTHTKGYICRFFRKMYKSLHKVHFADIKDTLQLHLPLFSLPTSCSLELYLSRQLSAITYSHNSCSPTSFHRVYLTPPSLPHEALRIHPAISSILLSPCSTRYGGQNNSICTISADMQPRAELAASLPYG